MSRTADTFVQHLMMDAMPSTGEAIDFGIDMMDEPLDMALYAQYQQAVRSGAVTADKLHAAVGDGPALSKLMGRPITTMWDELDTGEDMTDDERDAQAELERLAQADANMLHTMF